LKFFFRTCLNLNIDVVAGACLNALFFAHVLKVDVSWTLLAALGCSVWGIYTLDRIIDVAKKTPDTHRHRFHSRHRNKLLFVVAAAATICIGLLYYLPLRTVYLGAGLSGLVGVYLLIMWALKAKQIAKELWVAAMYSCGTALAAFSLASSVDTPFYFLLAQHFLLALSNLLIISFYEHEIDIAQHQTSLATGLGRKTTYRLVLFILGLVSFMALTSLYLSWFTRAHIVFLGMSGLLFLVLQNNKYFFHKERYRFWADAAFLLPGLLIIFPNG